jgi:hypothetical protein
MFPCPAVTAVTAAKLLTAQGVGNCYLAVKPVLALGTANQHLNSVLAII